jgi:SnoaL-like domain
MTDQSTAESSPALAVALAYHRAWTSKNVDEALTHVADDIVCDAPSGQLLGLDQYRPFLANFVPRVTGYDLIAALGDDETAVLVYDLHTIPVSSGLTCECFTVRDGHIARNRLIFDQTPYTAARQQAG